MVTRRLRDLLLSRGVYFYYAKALNRSSTHFGVVISVAPAISTTPLKEITGATLITTATSIQGFGVYGPSGVFLPGHARHVF